MEPPFVTTCHPYTGGAFFQVEETRTLSTVTGDEYVRHVVRHPSGAGVVAVMDGNAICVRQYRPAIEQEIVEIPAGRPLIGESFVDTALRELTEETGLEALDIQPLARFYNAPCFCDGITHAFLATRFRHHRLGTEVGEFPTHVVRVKLEDISSLITNGTLVDAKTIIALILAYQRLNPFQDPSKSL